MNIKLKKRTSDPWGMGYYGAPRGVRKHNGIDYACEAGERVLSPCEGEVTKIGYPYGDDLDFRYVQISNGNKDYRVFYIEPLVKVGDQVTKDTVIGTAQYLERRYPKITPHIHLEIRVDGEFVNPEEV